MRYLVLNRAATIPTTEQVEMTFLEGKMAGHIARNYLGARVTCQPLSPQNAYSIRPKTLYIIPPLQKHYRLITSPPQLNHPRSEEPPGTPESKTEASFLACPQHPCYEGTHLSDVSRWTKRTQMEMIPECMV
jgi:hypothetical protein